MLTANGIHHNGINGHYLDCPSDYEERPTIDVTPMAPPKGSWRDQLAPVTWSMSYTDSSGISHSCTLRGDTEEEVLAMVKPIVAGVRKAKELAKQKATVVAKQPESTTTDTSPPDVLPCKIHGVDMARRYSKRTNASYFSHRMPDDSLCYGRAPKA